GKAFPVNVQEASNKRPRGDKNEDRDEVEANKADGRTFVSANARKRFKQKEKKKAIAEVYNSYGHQPKGGKNGGQKPKKDKGKGNKNTYPPRCACCHKVGRKSSECWHNTQALHQGQGSWTTGRVIKVVWSTCRRLRSCSAS
ncbi:unnamed protein product, partial [Amoebophrya sp. A25]